MGYQRFFGSFPGRIVQFVIVMVNALLALMPVKLISNSMSSVSWNG
jgi:hypothetical protein